ncbi:DUF3306 domain-containing protein [Ramlibacter sp.]|uniref:DUF3306 domain-containing protein n=1 Tax=Ramlibacter sp. TaxID=1917967 RepID=UPI0035B181F2
MAEGGRDEGFLGRWARRKEAARTGRELPEPPPAAPGVALPAKAVPAAGTASTTAADAPPAAVPPAPPPTLEEAQALTPASDFSRFVRADVPPDVRNTAMKKLFADPHFNVMDGMDVYIDDYSKPDPLPLAMARQLAGARFLKLFDEDPETEGRDRANDPTAGSVAESGPGEAGVPAAEDDADPDLRLQPDDAPGPEGPGQDPR